MRQIQLHPGPFHDDELLAQRLAGSEAGGAAIRSFMPDQHREFFALLRYLFVATTDQEGWPLATILTGSPGFVTASSPVRLEVTVLPQPDDPAAPHFDTGQDLGILGLDLATRRRNRVNGIIDNRSANGVALTVRQSFGNCAQYIQRRRMEWVPRTSQPTEAFARLDNELRVLIAGTDTFFVASRARDDIGTKGGMDMSHRGGRPGCIRIEGSTLSIPDFRGNRYYNTLGNLLGEPRASLLFLDFECGDIVQMQGQVEIDWRCDAGANVAGAEHMWHFHVKRGWRRRGALPFCGNFIDYAAMTERTGTWHIV